MIAAMRILAAAAMAAAIAFAGCSRGGGADMPAAGTRQLPANQVAIAPQSQRAAGITVVRIRPRSIPETITAVGSLTVNEQKTDHIGVIFPGIVTRVIANVGDRVMAGAVLAQVHSHDLHDAIGAYQSAVAEIDRSRRQLEYARRTRDRYESLYEIKYASQQEAERARMDYQNATADFAKAQAMLQATRAHLAGMLQVPETGLTRLDLNADAMPIVAPHPGIVLARNVTPGMALQPGTEAFTVSDVATLWMAAAVSEQDLRWLHDGMPVTLRVRAFPNTAFDGRVTQLGPQLDPTTRTLSVRVLVPNPDGRLRPQMFATAEIARGGSRTALFAPEVSVQDLNGLAVIFVRHGDADFEARAVRTGVRVDGAIEILKGLSAGDEIVTDGSFVVKSQFLTRSLSEE